MADPPDVDGRGREELREHVEAIAPYYTDSWDPESPGPGTTVLELFAGMAEDVVERLDRVPEKHRVAFFDALGFDRKPPQPARIPLSFEVADGAGRNVVVDGGTRALAPAADGRPEQTFEIATDGRFEATPANLVAVHSVDPPVDGIYDHWDPPGTTGLSAGGEQDLFTGRNRQAHALYIGHVDQLNVTPDEDGADDATLRVKLRTETPWSVLRNDLVWEYYGERTPDGETIEGWHAFTRQPAGWETLPGRTAWLSRAILSRLPPTLGPDDSTPDEVVLDLGLDGVLTETTVNGVESRWIRARVPPYADVEDFVEVQIGTSVEVGPGPSAGQDPGDGSDGDDGEDGGGGDDGDTGSSPRSIRPDRLLYNDVELPFGEDRDTGDPLHYPLGTAPIPQDTFYIASGEAFTKSNARVQLSFAKLEFSPSSTGDSSDSSSPSNGGGDGDSTPTEIIESDLPRLSWEYWDGKGWSRIDDLEDETSALTNTDLGTEDSRDSGDSETPKDGTVTFPVPEDLAKTTVAGHENHWIRCRLVGGSYGKRIAKEDPDNTWETRHIVHPPQFEELSISYVPKPDAEGDDDGEGTGEEGAEPSGEPGSAAAALPLESANHLFAENNLAYSDDLVEDGRQRVTPFEALPDDEQTLYLGFDGRLHGGPITLFFDIGDRGYPTDFHSRIRWEYCADPAEEEWVRLDVQDGTEGLTERGIVSLVFPGETTPCSLFGTEFHWVRARVTGDPFEPRVFRVPFVPGSFDFPFDPGRFDPDLFDTGGFEIPALAGPTSEWLQSILEADWMLDVARTVGPGLSGETAGWTGTASAAGPVEHTDGVEGSESVRADRFRPTSEPTDPTRPPAGGERAVVEPLSADGPAELVGALDRGTSAGSFRLTETTPHLRVEHSVEGGGVSFDASTIGTQLFDPDEMADLVDLGGRVPTPRLPARPRDPVVPDWAGPWLPFLPRVEPDEGAGPIEPCGRTLETEPPSGDPTRLPPTVRTVAPNAGWAYNVRTVEDETLGSSDGDPSQAFDAAAPPVIDETVWVDELAALSEGRRRELREAETPAVETTTGGDGRLRAFWVEWTETTDLLDSGTEDRHYTVDRTAGRIAFGDGTRGRIPPRGEDNVRISYRTGGGPDGNVEAGAVAELGSSLQFVDGVSNPAAGTGGAVAESTDRAVSRAPKELRDRNRAVTEVDYERVAMDAARRLNRVECIPGMNRSGESATGWVTLLLVPNAPRTKPVPSAGLKEQVRTAVGDRAPATLVAADRLVVRGPSYVEVSVETEVVAEGRGSVATLEESVGGGVESFLHPLSGGEDGEGWAFGELPTMSDLYALLEGIDGVDHVESLSMRFETSEADATIREGEEPPSVSADALIHSGTHEVTVRLGAPAGDVEPEGS